ncbi:MAG: hypothetical protein H0X29_05395 [Parachlamydiaceae bacterium]|nr:hypothetical protein [Parachlamydiaceae bacterium]
MNLVLRLIPAIILGLSLSPMCDLQADPHGHIIHRDHDGNCSEDDDSDSSDSNSDSDYDDCDSESDEQDHHHSSSHQQKKIKPGYEEDDLTYEVDRDTAWPSKRENFSEMFR